jgi:hypothetical protein
MTNQKGQVFSIDLLIAIFLLIFGAGMLMAAAEFRIYNLKQDYQKTQLLATAENAAEIISDSNWSGCTFGKHSLAYSINKDKITSPATVLAIKQRTGLKDYNISLSVGSTIVIDETTDANNAVVIKFSILTCNNTTTFSDINACLYQSACNPLKVQNEEIILKVMN